MVHSDLPLIFTNLSQRMLKHDKQGVGWLYLITELDCGLGCQAGLWTGLLNERISFSWIVE